MPTQETSQKTADYAGAEPAPGAAVRDGARGTGSQDNRSLRAVACRLWGRVLDFGLILWVVRIPLVSVVLGALLMGLVPQAQDVMVDVAMADAPLAVAAGLSLTLAKLIVAVFLLWAIPVHYSARLLLETDRGIARLEWDRAIRAADGTTRADRFTQALVREVPRVLGALTFVVFALGAWRAVANLPTLADGKVVEAARRQLHFVAIAMLVAGALFFIYAELRHRFAENPALKAIDERIGALFAPVFRILGIAPRLERPGGEGGGELRATGRLTLFLYVFVVAIVLAANPLWLAHRLPLALAIPLIFGGWVPILSYLSSVGRQFRVPLVGAALVLGAVGVYVFGDNHAVRIVAAVEPEHRRTTLADAVFLWMRANGCERAPAECPRPVIVAAAGGASRAGFFAASTIGHFLDFEQLRRGFSFRRADAAEDVVRKPRDDGRFSPATEQALAGVDLANRLFAISGVSGGAYGAAVVAAALNARNGAAPPCPEAAPQGWFGAKVGNWRDCLEGLTSGDYLTATFFGLAFHDQVQLFLQDRAALLEQAWEQRFADIVTASGIRAAPRTPGRLAAPFLADERSSSHWIPFLLLNGTSTETGQRILTTDLKPVYAAPQACPTGGQPAECPVFNHTLDFHAIIRAGLDVALSTAASNSARFPVISPPGSIMRDGNILDRIVDGGYFENYGAQSALELAQAMVEVEPRLAPFVLVISNDPGSTLVWERATRGVEDPDTEDHAFLTEATGPLGAIGAVRSGRGRLAVAQTEQWLNARFGAGCKVSLAHIKVWPETRDGRCPAMTQSSPEKIREVSMSWWLSKPVQMNLREQLETTTDRCNNDLAVAQMWEALATPSRTCLVPAPQ